MLNICICKTCTCVRLQLCWYNVPTYIVRWHNICLFLFRLDRDLLAADLQHFKELNCCFEFLSCQVCDDSSGSPWQFELSDSRTTSTFLTRIDWTTGQSDSEDVSTSRHVRIPISHEEVSAPFRDPKVAPRWHFPDPGQGPCPGQARMMAIRPSIAYVYPKAILHDSISRCD